MTLQDRVKVIVSECGLKQKEFAAAIKVTESYVSNLLSGKRESISEPLASLIEEVYGYSSLWILTGEGDKYVTRSKDKALSPIKRKIIANLEKMTDDEVRAVLAFINSLDAIEKNIKE